MKEYIVLEAPVWGDSKLISFRVTREDIIVVLVLRMSLVRGKYFIKKEFKLGKTYKGALFELRDDIHVTNIKKYRGTMTSVFYLI